ncbi:hypothetical protein [Methanoculleus sp.]|jgi:hypothetical protein|uniref:hypothetical protein n=1 Tax=Methanoculleus sp. TaxID=90427 RepID=UPI002638A9F7|nr:hypothetical protein [Methanoculleus sp.]
MQTETGINQRFAAQLPHNLAANIAYFLVNVVIGVLLVPYFINTLGVAAYGLIPLATSITVISGQDAVDKALLSRTGWVSPTVAPAGMTRIDMNI